MLRVGRSDAPGFFCAENITFYFPRVANCPLHPLQPATSLSYKYIKAKKACYISLHSATFRYIFFYFLYLCYIFATK